MLVITNLKKEDVPTRSNRGSAARCFQNEARTAVFARLLSENHCNEATEGLPNGLFSPQGLGCLSVCLSFRTNEIKSKSRVFEKIFAMCFEHTVCRKHLLNPICAKLSTIL